MVNWKHRLDVKCPWEQASNDEITIQQLAEIVAKKLLAIDFKDEDVNYDRDDIADEFQGLSEDESAGRDDFDCVLARLYDFADEDHRLWVKTF